MPSLRADKVFVTCNAWSDCLPTSTHMGEQQLVQIVQRPALHALAKAVRPASPMIVHEPKCPYGTSHVAQAQAVRRQLTSNLSSAPFPFGPGVILLPASPMALIPEVKRLKGCLLAFASPSLRLPVVAKCSESGECTHQVSGPRQWGQAHPPALSTPSAT